MSAASYLGFDYGEKYLGVAVGQAGLAHALTTLAVKRGEPRWEEVSRLIGEWQPRTLIVGLPLNMDGTDNPMTAAARRFGRRLHARFRLPVEYVDERLTSLTARAMLRDAGMPDREHKSHLDKLAAQTILQAYLDATNPDERTDGDRADA